MVEMLNRKEEKKIIFLSNMSMFGTCHQNLIVTGLAIRDSNHGLKKKKNCPHLGIAIKTGDIFKDKNGCLLVNSVELRPITSPSEGFESNFTSSFKRGCSNHCL